MVNNKIRVKDYTTMLVENGLLSYRRMTVDFLAGECPLYFFTDTSGGYRTIYDLEVELNKFAPTSCTFTPIHYYNLYLSQPIVPKLITSPHFSILPSSLYSEDSSYERLERIATHYDIKPLQSNVTLDVIFPTTSFISNFRIVSIV